MCFRYRSLFTWLLSVFLLLEWKEFPTASMTILLWACAIPKIEGVFPLTKDGDGSLHVRLWCFKKGPRWGLWLLPLAPTNCQWWFLALGLTLGTLSVGYFVYISSPSWSFRTATSLGKKWKEDVTCCRPHSEWRAWYWNLPCLTLKPVLFHNHHATRFPLGWDTCDPTGLLCLPGWLACHFACVPHKGWDLVCFLHSIPGS